ncbi:hypothetical protein A8A54_04420 [Brucella pseudogrignonensis]|uniref:hypothetical protein n=1 Tax=Brucella pseudogrignonensis TaxID=419475 RepID=UPI0007DAA878|nr:hypothetical protein [Brucella pseudogrignonensis]ANG95796.1 hypothetical protein A8A54_04420 [Brucella pseudogrignonensis]
MFKNTKTILTATLALLSVTVAQSAFLPSQDTYNYESIAKPAENDRYYSLPISISGNGLPASFWCGGITTNWKNGQPFARNGVQAGYITLTGISTCAIQMPKNMTAGMYEATLSYQGQSQTYSFIYKDNEPILAGNQNAEYKSGDQIYISFSKPYSKLVPINLPDNLSARYITGDDYIVVEGSITSESTTQNSFQVYDLESDQKIDVNFTVTAPEKPEEKPDDVGNKTACNTTPKPNNGAKFVFRYRTGAMCS